MASDCASFADVSEAPFESKSLEMQAWHELSSSGMLIQQDRNRDIPMNAKLRELPVEERVTLVEGLRDGLAEDRKVLPVTPEQRAELDRRLAAYEIDKNRGRPAADVLADVRTWKERG